MRLFVLSDLHIDGPSDPVYEATLQFIEKRPQPGDRVVLAGDIFDLFVGDKSIFRQRYDVFFQVVRAAGERGVRFDYIEGNHDFLMRKNFKDFPNFSFHEEEVLLRLNNKRFYIAHGDLVDPSDYGYRILRAFFRSFLMKTFVRFSSDQLLDRIGKTSSKTSKNRNEKRMTQRPLEQIEKTRKAFRSFSARKLREGFDFVVLGHCHDLDEMFFTIGDRRGQYINMGFPRVHGSFLSWSEGEKKIQREALMVNSVQSNAVKSADWNPSPPQS